MGTEPVAFHHVILGQVNIHPSRHLDQPAKLCTSVAKLPATTKPKQHRSRTSRTLLRQFDSAGSLVHQRANSHIRTRPDKGQRHRGLHIDKHTHQLQRDVEVRPSSKLPLRLSGYTRRPQTEYMVATELGYRIHYDQSVSLGLVETRSMSGMLAQI